MSNFENVTLTKAANVYFDGNVTSRSITFNDGSTKTLGIMLPGEYTFNTGAKEFMEILSGDLEVLISGDNSWSPVIGGDSFEVPANSSFQVKIKTITDYCCSFIN
jgi:purine/pyrimidine-nucleoside phosphorylase